MRHDKIPVRQKRTGKIANFAVSGILALSNFAVSGKIGGINFAVSGIFALSNFAGIEKGCNFAV